ncbi:family 1 glycosylhydrolase [Paenochrobactrum sp. BZR 588]
MMASALPRNVMAATANFPDGFIWGVATSAGQTESREGRGRSNWDVFLDNKGSTADGTINQRNTEFQLRYVDEFKLLQNAGVNTYRFSFSWPRIQPETPGSPNMRAMSYYDRLVDSMLEHGLEPMPTLSHWETPLWAGDFLDRDITKRMGDFADIMARLVGDRAKRWLMFNEPNALAAFGYGNGAFAPGYRSREYLGAAIHHINLAQGHMHAAVKSNLPNVKISSAFNMQPVEAPSGKEEDVKAARFMDVLWNEAMPGPAYGKGYPDIIVPMVEPYIRDGDLETIAIMPDFFGANFYTRGFVANDPDSPLGTTMVAPPPDIELTLEFPYDPDSYTKVLLDIHKKYGGPEILATEFGFATKEEVPLQEFDEKMPKDLVINDPDRVRFMKGYITAALEAYKQGVNLSGMMYWSSTDNLEWTLGLANRFGLIHIDQTTQKRTPKKSLEYYASCIALNGPA